MAYASKEQALSEQTTTLASIKKIESQIAYTLGGKSPADVLDPQKFNQSVGTAKAYKELLAQLNNEKAVLADVQNQLSQNTWPEPPVNSNLPVAAANNPNPPVNPDVVVTPVPEQTVSNVFTSEFDPDPAPFAREIGALVPGDDVTTNTDNGLIEPPPDDGILRTPDGAIEGEGDAGTGLTEPPNDDGAAEGGNTVADAANAITRDESEMVITAKKLPVPSAPIDWRVRISLASNADYLYAAKPAGILSPLKDTDGVIFPYTPTIQVNYTAKYDTQSPTHSNYNIYNYQGSSVDSLTISGEFTAQSVTEANYLLAVIHFFKSATKMFYGKDAQRGTPPPLLYLSGYGQYQFDNHPMVLTSFNYSLPQDVDYVDAYSTDDDSTTGMAINGVSLADFVQPNRNTRPAQNMISSISRLLSGNPKITTGGKITPNSFKKSPDSVKSITRVPSKIAITLTLHPMITRRAINDHFSLKDYSTGKLLRSSKTPGTGGGIW